MTIRRIPSSCPDFHPAGLSEKINDALDDVESALSAPAAATFAQFGMPEGNASNPLGTPNTILLWRIYIPQAIQFTHLSILTAGGSSSFGIYTIGGQLKASVTNIPADDDYVAIDQGSVTLQPGWYLFAFTAANTSAFYGICSANTWSWGDTTASTSSGGVLPATITPVLGTTLLRNNGPSSMPSFVLSA